MLHMPQCFHLPFSIIPYTILIVLFFVSTIVLLSRYYMKRPKILFIWWTSNITYTINLGVARSMVKYHWVGHIGVASCVLCFDRRGSGVVRFTHTRERERNTPPGDQERWRVRRRRTRVRRIRRRRMRMRKSSTRTRTRTSTRTRTRTMISTRTSTRTTTRSSSIIS